ncbi:MAG: saccharopine dehydrogenase [Elusimicrobia bacterium GWA2_56_46]|nr:MAG: saccharopine dehydrogenase [Elusimicrobia bacterium GWA2_56_46]OGR54097.1 MAG: saccharopine dehydrogenase [Elusimicrobia bacterium GWC2_56_31]HBB66742.1 saccharopine dehydrogenase [Elusimicrobiota bacterium]HBW22959.1 saccharopine dehydrogenase [Elusimicrobiota bacterium]
MKKVLLLGAGLVARPLAAYLLKKGFSVTVADQAESKAAALLDGHANGRARAWTTDDKKGLREMVGGADLAVSLLPAAYHILVAEECLAQKKPMITASYVSPAMRALDARAKEAGVLILNEIGVDPGIDHMSAMKIIDRVKKEGGRIASFKSYCGGLPAPEANTNPWGYKFSWSPRGVLTAGKNSARYLKDGARVEIPGPELFSDMRLLDVPGLGELEAYPNRDSMGYIGLYGLEGAATVFRATLRNKGWCAAMGKIVNSGLLDEREKDLRGMTFRAFTASVVAGAKPETVSRDLAARLGVAADSDPVKWLEWLGLFTDEPLPLEKGSPLDVMTARMVQKMSYAEGERDMLVMHHEFIAEYPSGRGPVSRKLTSTLLDFGIPHGDSSMARTVSLPAAIAARLILEGKISGAGVRIPVTPDIYEPVLKELEEMENGIHFKEGDVA